MDGFASRFCAKSVIFVLAQSLSYLFMEFGEGIHGFGNTVQIPKKASLNWNALGLLNIDVFKRHNSKSIRIEIFFDKWFKYKDRGPKFSLFKPFRFNFCVYSVGRWFIF